MLIVPRAFMYYTAQLTFWITFCNLLRATIYYNSITLCNVRLTLYNSAPWSVPWACSMGRGASHPLFSFATLKFVLTRRCPGSERFGYFISKFYELAFNHNNNTTITLKEKKSQNWGKSQHLLLSIISLNLSGEKACVESRKAFQKHKGVPAKKNLCFTWQDFRICMLKTPCRVKITSSNFWRARQICMFI